ncbi:MAG: GIY-YIG nuclease family protein [FCB group bacterium]|nr:GIY-YIG nuclease family protein [FCB group bacterium]
MQISGFPKTKIRNEKIGKIIFSKVLEMSLVKYLTFIEKTTKQMSYRISGIVENEMFYAKVRINNIYPDMIEDKSGLRLEVSNDCLFNFYSTENFTENKLICSLNWIKTRNEFSLHILKNLLDYQSKYWFSGKKVDLKPLTLKQFLSLYPLPYLDQTRLSRLIPNLSIMNPQDQLINIRSLFISKKKHHALLIKEIVDENESVLKDKDIQYLLAQKKVHLSLRTICNCRKLLNIPNYKERDVYYEKDITFNDYRLLAKKYLNKIPSEPGVYELSISSKINYMNRRSSVIYLGCSNNLRKRIANYLGNKIKNVHLNNFADKYDLSVRFFLTEKHKLVEKKLLKNFKNKYSELPKANSLGVYL